LPEAIGERSDFMKEIRGKVKELGLSSNENKKIFKAIYEDAKQKQRKLSEKEVMDIITQLLGE
jgi:chorismate mutase